MIYNFDGLSFQVLTVDRFIHKEGHYDVKPRLYAALSFRVSGMGIFEVGDKRITVREGNILYMPANTAYKVDYSRSECIVAHLTDCNYHDAESIRLEHTEAMEHRFIRLLTAWNESHSVNRAKACIYDILDAASSDSKLSYDNTAFALCVRYMEANFCDPELSVAAVCAYGFISPATLQRCFVRYFGMSPKQYLIKLRLERAVELLAENRLSVKEIAFACGFNDEKYFSRLFREKYGHSPSYFKNDIVV